jgi:hypothetical protein
MKPAVGGGAAAKVGAAVGVGGGEAVWALRHPFFSAAIACWSKERNPSHNFFIQSAFSLDYIN